MASNKGGEKGGVQAIETGVVLLMALAARRGPQMLKQLAEDTGIHASKVHRYMVSLQRAGLVQQDERSSLYSLGRGALQLGLAALAGLEPVSIALNSLPRLRDEVNETVGLLVWGSYGPTFVKVEESTRPVSVNSRSGSVLPLLASASGRIFLAFMPSHATDLLLKKELAFNQRSGGRGTITTATQVNELVERTREQGFSRVAGDYFPGISALSAPVFDSRGELAAAVTILGPQSAIELDASSRQSHALLAYTREISAQLGYVVAVAPSR